MRKSNALSTSRDNNREPVRLPLSSKYASKAGVPDLSIQNGFDSRESCCGEIKYPENLNKLR